MVAEPEETSLSEWLKHAPPPGGLREGKKWHVFLSYRSVNRAWVIQLYDVLKELGYEVFLDQYVLTAADRLVRSLEEGLQRSESGVLVWSTDAKDSEWCRREYEAMTGLDDEDRDFHFVLTKLDEVALPVFARGKLYLDFSDAVTGPTGVNLLKLLWGIHGKTPPDEAIRLALHVDEGTRTARAQIQAAVDTGDPERLIELGGSTDLAFTASPMLGCETAEGLLALGEVDAALTVLEGVGARFRKAARPRQLAGLGLARKGDWRGAQRILAELRAAGREDPETLGLLGRTWFDRFEDTGEARYLRTSRDHYAAAFERFPDNAYVGLNAAAKSVFMDDLEQAGSYAERVERAREDQPRDDYWDRATDAELSLIKGAFGMAAKQYTAAVASAPEELASHRSTWRQASRLLDHLDPTPDERAAIARVFEHLD